jgi:hypothetical protein
MDTNLEQLFPLGTKVILKFSSCDEIGIVSGFDRPGMVTVLWPVWGREGKYMACSLIPAKPVRNQSEATKRNIKARRK